MIYADAGDALKDALVWIVPDLIILTLLTVALWPTRH
jgi:hypothetical protein